MAYDLSGGTTGYSNLSIGGSDANNAQFGVAWVGSYVSSPGGQFSTLTVGSGISTSIVTASRVSSNVSILANAVWASAVSASIISVTGGVIASGLTLDLRTNLVVLSMDTRANASAMTTGQLRLIFAASGISLLYSSGATQYTIAGSSTSLAQS